MQLGCYCSLLIPASLLTFNLPLCFLPSQGLLRALPHTNGGIQGRQRRYTLRIQDTLQEKHHLASGAHSWWSTSIPRLAHTGPWSPPVPADPSAAPGSYPTKHLLRQEVARWVQVNYFSSLHCPSSLILVLKNNCKLISLTTSWRSQLSSVTCYSAAQHM